MLKNVTINRRVEHVIKMFSHVINSANLVIAISSDVKKSLIEYGAPEAKVKVIFNGIDDFDHRHFSEFFGHSIGPQNMVRLS